MEHRIIQYDLEGNFIKVWDNTSQAATSGADSMAIIRKVLNNIPTKKQPNFIWRYYSDKYPKKITPTNQSTKSRQDDTIVEIDWKGNTVATYRDTADAAEQSGYSQSYICNVIAGKIKHPKRRFKRA